MFYYGHENAEMQKRKFDDVTLQYSIEFDIKKLKTIDVLLVQCPFKLINLDSSSTNSCL